MADLDLFKQVNDTFGHDAGDQVLCAFADLLRRECRREDLPCRFGGEEFVIVLPYTEVSEGRVLAERLRTLFEASRPLGNQAVFTVSMGIAPVWPDDTAQTFISRADQAMYAAKAQGRNRTVAAP